MNAMLAQIKGMLADSSNGSVSSKRVITFLATLMMCVGFVGNMFFGFQVDKNIYDSIMFVVMTGLGVTGLEKFAPQVKDMAKK